VKKKVDVEVPKQPTALDVIDRLASEINKTYGSPVMRRAGDIEVEKIPFGIASLDIETGGGAPRGRGIIVVGEESSFKSTLLYSLAGNAQRVCGNCFKGRIKEVDFKKCKIPTAPDKVNVGLKDKEYISLKYIADGRKRNLYCPNEIITHKKELTLLEYKLECSVCDKPEYSPVILIDAEQNYSKKWARKWGMIHHYTKVARTTYTQQIGEILREYMKSGRTPMIIVDSVDAQGPLEEENNSFEDWQMGLQARVWNKITRAIHAQLNKFHDFSYYDKTLGKVVNETKQTEPIIALVQQFREAIGSYGDPKVFGGGRGKKYLSSLTIGLLPGEKDWAEKGKLPEDKDMTGKFFNFDLIKHKTGRPHRQGRFYYSMEEERVINSVSLVQYGVKYGFVEKKGSWFEYGNIKKQGLGNIALAIDEDEKVYNKLFKQILDYKNEE
jgi:RecA/RadA recombinase